MLKQFMVSFIAIFGGFWTIIEAIGFFFEDSWAKSIKTWNNGVGFWILLVVSGTLAFLSLRVREKILEGKEAGEIPKTLVVRSRPERLYKALGKDPTKVKKVRDPTNVVEHKPEVVTDVEPDSSIIQRAFDEVGRRVLLKSLDKASKSDLAYALREDWDIVHFDCVVGPKGQLFLEDGEVHPQALRELLAGKNISLLVLMDCDSLKVAATANSAGVTTLLAVTGSLPVLAAEKFCYGLYRGIARNRTLAEAFSDAKALASVELARSWESTLFVLDGDASIKF